jgi:putative membrane protein
MQSTCQSYFLAFSTNFSTFKLLEFYICRMNFIVRLIISTLAVLITSYLLPGVDLDNFLTAVVVAVVLGFLNTVVKPILIFFSLPAVVFTLGLFLLVINTLIILLADDLITGFKVHGFWRALLFSVVLSIVTSVLNAIKRSDEERQ